MASTSSDQESQSSASENEEEDVAVESLVVGREKRSTAGNRMASLLDKEGDDDLELLFAENDGEEDVEFQDTNDETSDAELDSASDEDDPGPAKDGNDLTGEKELRRQERIDNLKKRKAQDAVKGAGTARKRVKIDPTAAFRTPATQQKKKSERVSWVPNESDLPTRTSSRKQTVHNREMVHERLIESEKIRLKVMQQMEEAARRKEATRPKTMTQADHLEEAAKVERKNAKSLSRWEEAEKKRQEEQKTKLEALRTRQLTGPVITWWSGLARWISGKIGQLGVESIRRAGYTEEPSFREVENQSRRRFNPSKCDIYDEDDQDGENDMSSVIHPHVLTESSAQLLHDSESTSYSGQYDPTSSAKPEGFLDGINLYAAEPMGEQQQPKYQAGFMRTPYGDSRLPAYFNLNSLRPAEESSNEPQAPHEQYTSRNLVALRNVDANALKLTELQSSVLIKKPRKEKVHRTALATCVITMQPARYRDPQTGLDYANSYAYKEVQRLRLGAARWSSLLDCYVGPLSGSARGVPDKFCKVRG